jgi:hypothetical protein
LKQKDNKFEELNALTLLEMIFVGTPKQAIISSSKKSMETLFVSLLDGIDPTHFVK